MAPEVSDTSVPSGLSGLSVPSISAVTPYAATSVPSMVDGPSERTSSLSLLRCVSSVAGLLSELFSGGAPGRELSVAIGDTGATESVSGTEGEDGTVAAQSATLDMASPLALSTSPGDLPVENGCVPIANLRGSSNLLSVSRDEPPDTALCITQGTGEGESGWRWSTYSEIELLEEAEDGVGDRADIDLADSVDVSLPPVPSLKSGPCTRFGSTSESAGEPVSASAYPDPARWCRTVSALSLLLG